MVKGEVKLLGAWPSPFVIRVRIALSVKSVKYDFLEETMNPKSELLVKCNPVYQKIPVLIHNDKSICESLNIVEYIDDVWSSGHSLLPSEPYDCAIQRFWALFLGDKLLPSMYAIGFSQGGEGKTAAIEKTKQGLLLLEEAFGKCSKGKPFFGGDEIGYLDIAFGSFLGWFRVTEIMNNVKLLDEKEIPDLVAWADRFCADAAVKSVMPETDKLLEFAKMYKERKLNTSN